MEGYSLHFDIKTKITDILYHYDTLCTEFFRKQNQVWE